MLITEIYQEQQEEFTIDVGSEYVFTPLIVRSKSGELHSLLTVYSTVEDEIKTYSIVGTDPIVFKVIRPDSPLQDNRIVRVQILSDVDTVVEKYDAETDDLVIDNDGSTLSLKIKQLPDFDNYDLMSDDTFEEKFGRRRKPYEHGLIGHLYLDLPPASEHNLEQDVGTSQNFVSKYDTEQHNKTANRLHAGDAQRGGKKEDRGHAGDIQRFNKNTEQLHHSSKMRRAISIYKSNRGIKRTDVIKLIMAHLDMSKAGASSYYTKAKHAVEDE